MEKEVYKEVYNAKQITRKTIKDVGLSILFPPHAIIEAIPMAIYNLSQVKNGIELNELNDRIRMMTEQYLDVRKSLGYPDRWGHYKNGNFICECRKDGSQTKVYFIIDGNLFGTFDRFWLDAFEKKYYDLVFDIVHNATDNRLLSKNRNEFMEYFNDVYYPWLMKTATFLLNSGAENRVI